MKKYTFYDQTIGQQIEFQRTLAEAGFTPKEAERIIKEPGLAKTMLDSIRAVKTNHFPEFDRFFKNRSEQVAERRRLDKDLPKALRISDSLFDTIDTTSNHYQMAEDCEFLLVSLGGFEKTQKSILELTKLKNGIWLSSQFQEDENKFCLHETAADYFYAKPGFYWVRINLMANWDPKNDHDRSVDQVWDESIGTKLNAGSLGNPALDLQDRKLRQMQNGIDFPYFDHADQQLSGCGSSRVPYSRWSVDRCEVRFYSHGSGYVLGRASAPALVE
jgi:hypothetical protein